MFIKSPILDIPKHAQVYFFYSELLLEYRNMANASADGSIMKMNIDEAHYLYEKL